MNNPLVTGSPQIRFYAGVPSGTPTPSSSGSSPKANALNPENVKQLSNAAAITLRSIFATGLAAFGRVSKMNQQVR